MKQNKMSLKTRKAKLTSLIEDCEAIGVAKSVVKGFKKQLREVDKEIEDEKKHRIFW